MAFNDWYDCEIVDLDSGGAIALDAEYTSLVIDFESREVAWREDTSTLPPPPSTLHRHLPPPPSTTTLHHHAPPPPSTTTLHPPQAARKDDALEAKLQEARSLILPHPSPSP